MLNSPPSLPNTLGRTGKWLLVAILIAALALLFARKITQLALTGLGVPAAVLFRLSGNASSL